MTLEDYYGNFSRAVKKYTDLHKEIREENYNRGFFHSRKREEIEVKISVYETFEEFMQALDDANESYQHYAIGYLRKIAIDKLREFENLI